eukprot:gnl/Spiro4/2182_TR1047_c0_g1_i1.p1 gnl/Spiro4/2182_TR1047_c0_g1~~gnl/Spiro4/2182_TR1047_c0_g1_i1.p1  ORF type:complete len:695 (+),score=208.09 gnl/Spiro4/2182_TR1047_c0_g1_i1:59-2086(+)
MEKSRALLLPVSSSTLNSRASLSHAAPSRVSLGPAPQKRPVATSAASSACAPPTTAATTASAAVSQRKSESMNPSRLSMGRQSMGGTMLSRQSMGGSRRSMLFGKGGVRGERVDPRPLGTPAFFKECGNALLHYLMTHGFDQPLEKREMSGPTTKQFYAIFNFLASKIDPLYRFGPKLQDEVQLFFRRVVRYPVSISATALVTVSAPHTWPTLLAAFKWLVDLLLFDESRGDPSPSDFLAKYIGQAYRAWLRVDDELLASLEADVRNSFAQRNKIVQDEVDALASSISVLQTDLATLTNQPRPIDRIKSDIAKFEQDKAVFVQKHAQNVHMRQSHLDRIAAQTQQLAQLERELAAATAERDTTRAQVAAQTMCVAEYHSMKVEHGLVEEQLKETRALKAAAQTALYEKENQARARTEEIERTLRTFNRLAETIALTHPGSGDPISLALALAPAPEPETEPTPHKDEVQQLAALLALDPVAVPASAGAARPVAAAVCAPLPVLCPPLRTVKPLLIAMKETAIQRVQESQRELEAVSDAVERAKEQESDKQDEMASLESRLGTMKTTYRNSRETFANDMRVTEAERDALARDSARTLKSISAQLQQSTRELEALKSQYGDCVRSFEEERKMYESQLLVVLDHLAAYKDVVNQSLQTLEHKARGLLSNIEAGFERIAG